VLAEALSRSLSAPRMRLWQRIPYVARSPPEPEGARVLLGLILLIVVLFVLIKIVVVAAVFGVFALIVLIIILKEGL
jgi:hypothetical protein